MFTQSLISLAVLADADPGYRPGHFEEVVAGSGVHFRFRAVKLLDSEPVLDEPLASGNPFALLVAAQLTAKRVKDGRQRVDRLKEGNTVSYVSILERRGIEQGIEQGIELGERSVLIRLLTRRFGSLDEPTTIRLQQASAAGLERWTENILDAKTLEEVFTLH